MQENNLQLETSSISFYTLVSLKIYKTVALLGTIEKKGKWPRRKELLLPVTLLVVKLMVQFVKLFLFLLVLVTLLLFFLEISFALGDEERMGS
uniref:Transmembrane protein n=1 Tax=Salix viminalis TaxID=40686 RepID=A0A6N2NA22_SALVM